MIINDMILPLMIIDHAQMSGLDGSESPPPSLCPPSPSPTATSQNQVMVMKITFSNGSANVSFQ